MVAVYWVPVEGASALFWLSVSLGVLGILPLLGNARAKRALIVCLAGALVLGGVTAAYAIPTVFCDPVWKWLGWC